MLAAGESRQQLRVNVFVQSKIRANRGIPNIFQSQFTSGRSSTDLDEPFILLSRDLLNRSLWVTGRSVREGIDTSNASGRMVAGVLASLAELELELGKERRTAARDARRARGQSIGRPRALDQSKMALAQRMHASGESAGTIAATLGVSRATVYRVLADSNDDDQ
jgi:hypothetical protein